MVYLFIGEDELAKKQRLESIKKKLLTPKNSEFNYELIFAKEIDLKSFQEILSRLPVNSKKRIVVVKDALRLSDKIKEFLVNYVKNPLTDVVLILDVLHDDRKDPFLKKLLNHIRPLHFQERELTDTFKLCDELDRKRVVSSLKILHKLLSQGEKPERILGGLRYRWERGYLSHQEKMKRLNLLLNCDIDIKRGRLEPKFSLERLVINLCCF